VETIKILENNHRLTIGKNTAFVKDFDLCNIKISTNDAGLFFSGDNKKIIYKIVELTHGGISLKIKTANIKIEDIREVLQFLFLENL